MPLRVFLSLWGMLYVVSPAFGSSATDCARRYRDLIGLRAVYKTSPQEIAAKFAPKEKLFEAQWPASEEKHYREVLRALKLTDHPLAGQIYRKTLQGSKDAETDLSVKRALEDYLQALSQGLAKVKLPPDHALTYDPNTAKVLAQVRKQLQGEISRMKNLHRNHFGKLAAVRNVFSRLFGSPESKKGAALEELAKLDAELSRYDYRSPQFRKLAERKLELLKNFGGIPEITTYATAFANLFHIKPGGRPLTEVVAKTPLEKEILAEFLIGSAFHQLPGTTESKVAKARARVPESTLLEKLASDEAGLTKLPPGDANLFSAAETFALWRSSDPTAKLTEAENALADAYENTVVGLREKDWELKAGTTVEDGALGFIASMTSEEWLPTKAEYESQKKADNYSEASMTFIERMEHHDNLSKAHEAALLAKPPFVIPRAESGSPTGQKQFVLDRFRYLAASNGKIPLDQALRTSADIREGQADSHWTDQWWVAETRAIKAYSGPHGGKPIAVKRGEVLNSGWGSLYGLQKGFLIDADNVPNGGITTELINGVGFHATKGLVKRGDPTDRLPRMFDPAQREALTRGDISQVKRTTGWKMVAEVPVTESGNENLLKFTRRVFWNEPLEDGYDLKSPKKPGTSTGNGDFRIAQQSTDLRDMLGHFNARDPLKAELERYLKVRGKEFMPKGLKQRLQDRFSDVGEIDEVRGEIVVNIEALLERNGVTLPLQWTWNGKLRQWEANDTVTKVKETKEGKTVEEKEAVLMNCRKCHAGGSSVARMNGRCILNSRSDKFFSYAAQRILGRQRSLDEEFEQVKERAKTATVRPATK